MKVTVIRKQGGLDNIERVKSALKQDKFFEIIEESGRVIYIALDVIDTIVIE